MSSAESNLQQSLDPAILGAADRLRETFDSGRTRPLAWRREQLKRLKDLVSERSGEFVTALQADFGKPELEAWTMDFKGRVKVASKKNFQMILNF